eukprot:TRINITY_DN8777_c1_g1_i1.p2 TRINITY_DN8777_c1_g1~~TRINITY_DN8777_c1_g1_i1.p2  ORF type:complete len:121 (+),score=13.02 TRINITY_DN8777_c1_g1_i1:237-599(+)
MPACASSGHSRMRRCGRQPTKQHDLCLYELAKVLGSKKSEGSVYTMEEVARHNTSSDAWVTAGGKVYNITNFETHPGGRETLLRRAGTDVTEDFLLHKQKSAWDTYCIGNLEREGQCVLM